jgi:hypothetical protein
VLALSHLGPANCLNAALPLITDPSCGPLIASDHGQDR